MQETKLGTVRIAPSVLATIVSLTARSVKGVAGMSQISHPPGRVLQRVNMGTSQGVSLQVRNTEIAADVYIVAEPDTNLRTLGQVVQRKVQEALDQMVGMTAKEVNVYIEDVSE